MPTKQDNTDPNGTAGSSLGFHCQFYAKVLYLLWKNNIVLYTLLINEFNYPLGGYKED